VIFVGAKHTPKASKPQKQNKEIKEEKSSENMPLTAQSAEKTDKKEPSAEIKDLTDTLQRLQAEFENYKKRVEKEACAFRNHAIADLITKMLPVLDNFELALSKADKKDAFYKGVELIYAQLLEMLEHEGLKIIPCLGEKFDPYKHEALLAEQCDKEPNTVTEELQKGYVLNERILRHSKVKVAK
jgi:molecular chaperone GrpE